MANRGGRDGKRKRKTTMVKAALFISCASLGSLILLASPVFHIRTVNVQGASVYSKEDILKEMGLDPGLSSGDSIFYSTKNSMTQGLSVLPYVRRAKVEKIYPNTLNVTVTERIPRGYVFDDKIGLYLCLDEDGIVLSVTPETGGNLPVITGLKFSGYEIGKVLAVENEEAFDSMVRLSELFNKYGMTDVSMADVSNSSDIRLFIDGVEVLIGPIEGADYSVNWAKTCLAGMGSGIRGTLYAMDDENTYFSFPK